MCENKMIILIYDTFELFFYKKFSKNVIIQCYICQLKYTLKTVQKIYLRKTICRHSKKIISIS